ncbi:IS110 family transposase, partial [Streptomyces sp. NPDC058296]|uniref:IS110 family transposase n=1 Tax=Streptomyces sp. NPDC058296 TaxID=3346432 RepID=UPI0036E6ADE3
MDTIVAHTRSFVIGVDTHARTHTYAILAANGEHLGTETFPNTHAGRARAIAWAGRRTSGDLSALWVIEGVGSYGAQIARQTALAGYQVVEAARMGRTGRRGIGKSDPIDARRIATAVLPLAEEQLRTPRMDEGIRAAAQILLTARDELTGERTRAVNALTALVRVTDLGIDARRPLGAKKIGEIARWRPREEDLATTTARTEAVRLAKRILTLDTELSDNMNRTGELVDASPAADLLRETGIGPVTAATVLVAWSHPGRVRDEAAFAALAGVNPIPASSGNTTRHR